MSKIPFLLLGIQESDKVEYEIGFDTSKQPEFHYDAKTQMSNVITMGESKPTTRSTITSTGVFNDDGDESSDDTGTD